MRIERISRWLVAGLVGAGSFAWMAAANATELDTYKKMLADPT